MMQDLTQRIEASVEQMKNEMIQQRRDLHRHPEPGWTEFRTAALVGKTLQQLGYEVKAGKDAIAADSMMGVPSAAILQAAQQRAIAEGADPDWVKKMTGGFTGIVAVMKFSKPGPVVGIRVDMDSNDVTETTEPAHRPNQEGFASQHPKAMHACGHDGHTTVGLAIAKILATFKDELAGTIKLIFQPAEEGVRGAMSRHAGGTSRINVGTLEAGSGRNIVGDKALIRLETRGATSEINAYMEDEAVRILKSAALMYDVKIRIEKVGGAAGGSNTPALAAYLEKHANALGIFQQVVGICDFGASEDFSYFMERVQQHGGQAAYMMIGANLAAGHHDSHFDFDETALGYSAKMLATTAAELLLGANA